MKLQVCTTLIIVAIFISCDTANDKGGFMEYSIRANVDPPESGDLSFFDKKFEEGEEVQIDALEIDNSFVFDRWIGSINSRSKTLNFRIDRHIELQA